MKLRIIENGVERIHEVQEHESLITIGRAKDCDIILDENKSSRRHCQIRKTDEGYFIKDLDSSNGTIVNKEKIQDFKLTLGDKIVVGKAIIYFGEPEPIKITPIQSNFGKSKDILKTERREDIKTLKPQKSFFSVVKNAAIVIGIVFVAFILVVLIINLDLSKGVEEEIKKNDNSKKTPVVADTEEDNPDNKVQKRQRMLALREADAIILSEDTVLSKENRLKSLMKRKERAAYYSEIYLKYEGFLKNISEHLYDELERTAYESIEYIRNARFSEMLDIYNQFKENYKNDPKYHFAEVRDELFEKIDYLTDSANDYFYDTVVSKANELIDAQDWEGARQFYLNAKNSFKGFNNLQILCQDLASMIDGYIDVIKNGKYEKLPEDMVNKLKDKTNKPKVDKKDNAPKPSDEKFNEDALLVALQKKLLDSINRVNGNYMISKMIYLDPNDKKSKFSISTADDKAMYDRKGNALYWLQTSKKLINELYWRIKKKDLETYWAMAAFNYKHGQNREAGEVLGQIYIDNKELKSEIDRFISKHIKREIPADGFIFYRVYGERPRIITPEEMQIIENKKIIKKMIRELKKDFKKLLRTSKGEKLQKLNGEIKGQLATIMKLGATDEIAEIIDIIRETMMDMAKKAKSGQGHITPAMKQKLDAARAEALARINDEVRYPYSGNNHGERDANGEHGQPWVDEAVDKVKELWDDPAYGRLDVILSEILNMFDEYINIIDSAGQYHNPDDDQKIMEDLARQLEDDKIMRDNDSAGPEFCTPNEKAHVRIVNEYRIMLGVSPVRINSKLCNAARSHSQYMKSSGQFAHNIPGHPDGETPNQRAVKAGYRGSVSENITMSSSGHTPRSSFDSWYHSSGHHRNMVNRAWRVMGVGDAGTHWTQMFGGSPDGSEPMENK